MTTYNEISNILDKWQFFYGQRAGRELWMDKPTKIQEEDLANFNRDLETVRSFIVESPLKRISMGQIPPLGKYVLIYANNRPWRDSTDQRNAFWRVAKLVKRTDMDDREVYIFDEVGPDYHRFEDIDVWCDLPYMG